jgi:hypothetical protein
VSLYLRRGLAGKDRIVLIGQSGRASLGRGPGFSGSGGRIRGPHAVADHRRGCRLDRRLHLYLKDPGAQDSRPGSH